MEKDKINLLIVDDEDQFLESISKSLEVRDFNVVAVNRGEKAIEAARKTHIDIALVDLKMPGINGEEALKNAYKKKVMNKKKIQEKKMDELLKISLSGSARDILRRLKEIDKEEKI